MHWLETIRRCFDLGSVVYTRHARLEMKGEKFGHILEKEVYEAVCSGEVERNIQRMLLTLVY